MLPTPAARLGDGRGGPSAETGQTRLDSGRRNLDDAVAAALLPTPAVNDMGAGKSVDAWDEWTGRMKAAHGNGNGYGKSLHIEAARTRDDAWGAYGQAVARWEDATGRQAPAATEPGAKGQPRLSPAFVEWMMGLPHGWVTAVPGVSRNAQLKALGNGVVPQQAAEALRRLLGGAR